MDAVSQGLGESSECAIRLSGTTAVLKDNFLSTPATLSISRRVLVVDDGVGAAKMLKLLVSRLGPHEVEVAHDGPSALVTAGRFSPDLVLLDIGLPRMDGYEVARRLRESADFASATLVALTGYSQEEDRKRSYAAGFNEHVVKPIGLDMLRKLLACPKRTISLGK